MALADMLRNPIQVGNPYSLAWADSDQSVQIIAAPSIVTQSIWIDEIVFSSEVVAMLEIQSGTTFAVAVRCFCPAGQTVHLPFVYPKEVTAGEAAQLLTTGIGAGNRAFASVNWHYHGGTVPPGSMTT